MPTSISKFILLVFLCTISSYAQEKSLKLEFPEELIKKNDALIHSKDLVYEIVDFDKVLIKEKTVVTVLNKDGASSAQTIFFHDNQTKYKKLNLYAYNSKGNLVRKIKKSEFNDVSASDGISLFNDGRWLYYDYKSPKYPYTLVIESEYETANTGIIRPWRPVANYDVGVKQASFRVISDKPGLFSHVEQNLDQFGIEVKKNATAKTQYQYLLSDFSGISYESMAPRLAEIGPSVNLVFKHYQHEGYEGKAEDWDEMAKWYYANLLQGRDALSPQEKIKIHKLTDSIVATKDKVRAVYEYMQDRTRYISVQVGIGGWMPTPATEVSSLGYGDCKGLTNYTLALLKEIGIPAYHTLIYGGNDGQIDFDDQLMRFQGNHMILNVPLNDEELWLECTSQDAPFGYLGDFTSDRQVLVIYPDKGVFKRTTSYSSEDSFQKTNARVSFDQLGQMKADIELVSSGVQYDNRIFLEGSDKKDQREYFKKYWSHIPELTIDQVSVQRDKNNLSYHESIQLHSIRAARKIEDRLIININQFNRSGKPRRTSKERKQSFQLKYGYKDLDVIEYQLPEGYILAKKPANHEMEYEFGWYKTQVELIDGILVYTREILMKPGVYPAEIHDDYKEFSTKKYHYDREKIILIEQK